jgi:SAM-dependent methyltransferase
LPDDDTLRSWYRDFGYWQRDRIHQGITKIEEGPHWQTYLDARLGILKHFDLLNRANTVFEIGCTEGMLLHALGKEGLTASGCELNRDVAREGIRKLGVNIATGSFEAVELQKSSFDFVISFHTLEHMRHPRSVFAKIAAILKPHGAVLVEVPCDDSEYENTDHLHFFSKHSLRLLIERFFTTTEILDNAYTTSSGTKVNSIYGFGRGVRSGHCEHDLDRTLVRTEVGGRRP